MEPGEDPDDLYGCRRKEKMLFQTPRSHSGFMGQNQNLELGMESPSSIFNYKNQPLRSKEDWVEKKCVSTSKAKRKSYIAFYWCVIYLS